MAAFVAVLASQGIVVMYSRHLFPYSGLQTRDVNLQKFAGWFFFVIIFTRMLFLILKYTTYFFHLHVMFSGLYVHETDPNDLFK